MSDPRFERPGGSGGDSGDQEVDYDSNMSNFARFGLVAGAIVLIVILGVAFC